MPLDIQGPEEHRPQVNLNLAQPDPREVITVRQQSLDVVNFVMFVRDQDDQTLTVRLFIDGRYGEPIEPRRNTIPPQPGVLDRSYVLPFEGLCDAFVDFQLGAHTLEFYVSDNGFVDEGKDLRLPDRGGQRDSVLWRFDCLEPVPGAGGGNL